MGTRSMTIVKSKGKIKIAQYKQMDGHPTKEGAVIANFLQNDMDLKSFKTSVDNLKWASKDDVRNAWKKCGGSQKTEDESEASLKFSFFYPQFDRYCGAEILGIVQTGFLSEVFNSSDPKTKDSDCDYIYELDLDKSKITVIGKGKFLKLPFAKFKEEEMENIENIFYKIK